MEVRGDDVAAGVDDDGRDAGRVRSEPAGQQDRQQTDLRGGRQGRPAGLRVTEHTAK